jgi:hypothetical protein
MATIAFLSAHLDLILLVLLALSEWLAMNKKIKANSVIQLLIQLVRSLIKDKKVG